jgi:hypothetical protein
VGARGFNGLGEGHRRQHGGEPPDQHPCNRTEASSCVTCWPMWSGGLGVKRRASTNFERICVRARCGHSHPPASKG